ncbi:hypothetical protein AVEN_95088-1, partial [Araneus ventricosus]
WSGSNCGDRCAEGTYGSNCAQQCNCRNEGKCDHVNGSCDCPSGFKGDKLVRFYFIS